MGSQRVSHGEDDPLWERGQGRGGAVHGLEGTDQEERGPSKFSKAAPGG